MRKKIYVSVLATALSVFIVGCSSDEQPKPTKVNSSIINGYLVENGDKIKSADVNNSIYGGSGKSSFEHERDIMMTRLVKTPPTPIRVPDTILRVLIMPYTDDSGVLTAQSYKFAKVDDGKWIMGEYLEKSGQGIQMLTPLQENLSTDEDVQPQPKKKQNNDTSEVSQQVFNPMANQQNNSGGK
jgi:hypothetical protein